jgi:hypothetical protein
VKEDILEQIVDDYLQVEGYFTQHNLKFKPDPKHPHFEKDLDSNYSREKPDATGFTFSAARAGRTGLASSSKSPTSTKTRNGAGVWPSAGTAS